MINSKKLINILLQRIPGIGMVESIHNLNETEREEEVAECLVDILRNFTTCSSYSVQQDDTLDFADDEDDDDDESPSWCAGSAASSSPEKNIETDTLETFSLDYMKKAVEF